MAADEAGEVALARQEIDFLEEIDGLGVVAADPLGVAVHFLRERDAHAEVGRLGELGEFERLDFIHTPRFHPGGLEVRLGAGRVGSIRRRDKFDVVQQVLLHANVFAAHRAVRDPAPALFAIARVVPGITVLLMIVSAGLKRLMYPSAIVSN